MASWRDTVSTEAQADLDGLLNAVLPFAEQQLAEHGEFFPFGASLSADGSVGLLAADPGLGEQPMSDDVLSTLYLAAVSEAKTGSTAFAFVADVRVSHSDAIRVDVEHAEGVALRLTMPYKLNGPGVAITPGTMSLSLLTDTHVWQ